jgi:hypothetical protein
MKKCVLLIALVSLLALGGQAMGAIGTIDNVPAATLLLPYFEVDLASTEGVTTLFSINNASATAVLAHVTIWSEWSVPIIDFDVYLTGYDVATINLRDIIVNGVIPRTASVGQDPGDTISNQGPLSQDINFASCTGVLPYGPISASFRAHIQQALSGQPMTLSGGLCAATPGNISIARGYITVDTVNACNQLFPNSAGYFIDGGAGVATNQNVLWGDYFIVDSANNFAQGMTLVHVEAAAGLTCLVAGTTPATFYCRYALGADDREALGSKFAVRYLQGGVFDGGTSLLSYRDPSPNAQFGSLRSCASPPTILRQANLSIFDEEENLITITTGPSGEPIPQQNPFPYEANRTVLGDDLTTGSFSFGWLFVNLNGANTGADADKNQAYLAAVLDAEGRFSVGYDAIQLNNLTVSDLGPAQP